MSVINDDKVDDANTFHSIQDGEMDDYLNSESSDEDYTDDEVDEDNNNNNDSTAKQGNLTGTNNKNRITCLEDPSIQEDRITNDDSKCSIDAPVEELTGVITWWGNYILLHIMSEIRTVITSM